MSIVCASWSTELPAASTLHTRTARTILTRFCRRLAAESLPLLPAILSVLDWPYSAPGGFTFQVTAVTVRQSLGGQGHAGWRRHGGTYPAAEAAAAKQHLAGGPCRRTRKPARRYSDPSESLSHSAPKNCSTWAMSVVLR